MNKAVGLVGVGLVVLALVLTVVVAVDYTINVSYPYRKAIGAYIDNAYDASTFEVMKDNLQRAEAGMRASLSPEDCGRAWSWEQTQDWCMAYTYQYVDGLINRSNYYIQLFKGNPNATFTDVYTQSINNMREEMHRNGPVDWAAWPAWELKYHNIYYWTLATVGLWLLLALMIIVGIIAIGAAMAWD